MHRNLIVFAALALSACGASAGVETTDSVSIGVPRTDGALENDSGVQPPATETSSVSTIPPTTAPAADSVDAQAGSGSVPSTHVELRSAESCSIAWKTLQTGMEAYYAQNGEEITSADQLVSDGYLIEIDADLMVDFGGDFPLAVSLPGGACDYDFVAERDAQVFAENERWCWVDHVVAEVAIRGYTAEFGVAPESFAEIAAAYPTPFDTYEYVALGSDGEIVDLIEGGCSAVQSIAVLGEEWIDAPWECGIDALSISVALHLTDRIGDPDATVAQLATEGWLEQRDHRYQVTDGDVGDIAGSACPFVGPTDDDLEQQRAHGCSVALRTLETASEAFFAVSGRHPVSVDQLVEENYLMDGTDLFELVPLEGDQGVSVEPVAGGDCDVAE